MLLLLELKLLLLLLQFEFVVLCLAMLLWVLLLIGHGHGAGQALGVTQHISRIRTGSTTHGQTCVRNPLGDFIQVRGTISTRETRHPKIICSRHSWMCQHGGYWRNKWGRGLWGIDILCLDVLNQLEELSPVIHACDPQGRVILHRELSHVCTSVVVGVYIQCDCSSGKNGKKRKRKQTTGP